jgi:putative methyltransferase (TIGR04325 family)
MRLKEAIRLATPPALFDYLMRFRGKSQTADFGLSGNYSSWREATTASIGYDSGVILAKTKEALLKVKKSEAIYERDSVLFDRVQHSWPLLAGLMWAAARTGGKLHVLDFGGSLGSTYYQNRAFLNNLLDVRWSIVEQPSHVEIGKMHFEDDHLRFYTETSSCLVAGPPNVLLFSSVLQYLEHPFMILDQASKLSCDTLIMDRTPFWDGPTDRLCVQTVPPDIYSASYPSWIFSMSQFCCYLEDKWQIIAEFDALDRLPAPVETAWKGFILQRSRS